MQKKCVFAAAFGIRGLRRRQKRSGLQVCPAQRHDDGLGKVAEVFAEQVDPAAVFGVRLDADIQLDGSPVVDVQVVESHFCRSEDVVDEDALGVDGDLLQQAELRARERPVEGSVLAPPAAEVAGRGERRHFDVVDAHRDIGGPLVVVIDGLRADLEGEGDGREGADARKVGGEVVGDEAGVEPEAFRAGAERGEEEVRVVEPEQGPLFAEHPAGRFDVAVREHPSGISTRYSVSAGSSPGSASKETVKLRMACA